MYLLADIFPKCNYVFWTNYDTCNYNVKTDKTKDEMLILSDEFKILCIIY